MQATDVTQQPHANPMVIVTVNRGLQMSKWMDLDKGIALQGKSMPALHGNSHQNLWELKALTPPCTMAGFNQPGQSVWQRTQALSLWVFGSMQATGATQPPYANPTAIVTLSHGLRMSKWMQLDKGIALRGKSMPALHGNLLQSPLEHKASALMCTKVGCSLLGQSVWQKMQVPNLWVFGSMQATDVTRQPHANPTAIAIPNHGHPHRDVFRPFGDSRVSRKEEFFTSGDDGLVTFQRFFFKLGVCLFCNVCLFGSFQRLFVFKLGGLQCLHLSCWKDQAKQARDQITVSYGTGEITGIFVSLGEWGHVFLNLARLWTFFGPIYKDIYIYIHMYCIYIYIYTQPIICIFSQ